MPITPYGTRELLLATLLFHGAGGAALWAAINISPLFWIVAMICWAKWVFVLSFFRDPHRTIPSEPGILVSPADGKVTEITRLESYEGIDGPALRIGIFLSVFNVHVNRIPCDGRVVRTQYQPGEFLDARHPECGARNEANTIVIEPNGGGTVARPEGRGSSRSTAARPEGRGSSGSAIEGRGSSGGDGPVIVRQVAGLIARRIVCRVQAGDRVTRGQRLGMIKFGSRTELIVPVASGLMPAVSVYDHVKGGSTVLMRPSPEQLATPAADREEAAAEAR